MTTGEVLGGFVGFTTTEVSEAEMQRIRDRENPHAATRRQHGLKQLEPFVGRRSIGSDELVQARQALRTWGDLLDVDTFNTLAGAVRETVSAHQAAPPAEPAPDPAAVAAALRRLAAKVEAGDPAAGRAIIRAASD